MYQSRCVDTASSTNLIMAFSQRADGNMARTNETRIQVAARRHAFLASIGLDRRRLALIRPSHSPNIELATYRDGSITREVALMRPRIETDFDNYYDGSDGLLTFDREVAVALVSADCVPLVVWDNESGLHGILHIGLLGVLNNMVSGLPPILNAAGINHTVVHCYLGPSIRSSDYFISTSGLWTAIEEQARQKVPTIHKYLDERDGETTLDVQGMLTDQLQYIGLPLTQVRVHPGSTASKDSLYFSHHNDRGQREKRRFMSVIGFAS